MNSTPEVPEPEESGSDGQQVRAEDKGDLSLPQPVGRPMTDAITGLASSNSRAFGGEVASTLIAGATSQMSVELDQTRKELTEQRKQNDQLSRELSDEKIRSAVLAERISSFHSTRHLKKSRYRGRYSNIWYRGSIGSRWLTRVRYCGNSRRCLAVVL